MMKVFWYRVLYRVILLTVLIFPALTQEASKSIKPPSGILKSLKSSFEIMESIDEQLKILNGLNQAQLTVLNKKGVIKTYKINYFKKNFNLLITFRSTIRGNLLKVLYKQLPDNIYAYEVNSKRMSQKRTKGRFDSILGSGFYYIDMVGLPFSENYASKLRGFSKQDGKKFLKVECIPLIESLYSKVDFLVNHEEDYKLIRIDYFDQSGTLWKTSKIQHGKLPSRNKTKTVLLDLPVQYEMIDLTQNTISHLEFFLNNQTAYIDDSLFNEKNILAF